MGWGGMGTPFPHPNFISKFIIIFPIMGVNVHSIIHAHVNWKEDKRM